METQLHPGEVELTPQAAGFAKRLVAAVQEIKKLEDEAAFLEKSVDECLRKVNLEVRQLKDRIAELEKKQNG